MAHPKSYHMSPDQFRKYGRLVVDWVADDIEKVEDRPVLSRVAPGEIRASLPEAPHPMSMPISRPTRRDPPYWPN